MFSIPLDPSQLTVIYPAAVASDRAFLQGLLRQRCGCDISFVTADDLPDEDLKSRDFIIMGNMSNNRWLLDLYKQRYAFADAYFPGAGGYVIHPAKSIWNPSKNILVIEASDDDELVPAFRAFIAMLPAKTKSIGPLRRLKTNLAFPSAPTSVEVEAALQPARLNPRVDMPPYSAIADWGLEYHLTGDQRLAADFLTGFRLCFERAQETGVWVPEQWTNVYFNLWKMVYAWELIDYDPRFSAADRKMIDEVLWGYTRFCDWLPNLNVDEAPPNEPRQNHTTFLALSLFYAYRYFTEEYAITGLGDMVAKYKRAFEHGAATSYQPNDNAAGYIEIAPEHLLTYEMATGENSFLASGRLKTLAELLFLDLDNRNDPVSFGDTGGYHHRRKGAMRGSDLRFFTMAAWYYQDKRFQAIYDWDKKVEGPRGPDLLFSLEELYLGNYAVKMPTGSLSDFLGIRYVLLDNAALRWIAMRCENAVDLPHEGEKYFDKLAFRPDLNPQSEYMLIDGLSTFSHGHYDGNTVLRLTWKDRVWLFESDYIKLTPKYHNGVVVTRNGVQEPPPPLTTLDYAAEFQWGGATKTVCHSYNGSDWARTVIWRKGKYFVVLDEIKADRAGHFRMESRWRVVGNARLEQHGIASWQGDEKFSIKTADDAPRSVYMENGSAKSYTPGSSSSPSDLPVSVYYGRKELTMSPGGKYTFASLMYASSRSAPMSRKFYKGPSGSYIVSGAGEDDVVGTDMTALQSEGIDTDASLFLMDSDGISLINATQVEIGSSEIQCAKPFHISAQQGKGLLTVPHGGGGQFRLHGIRIENASNQPDGSTTSIELKPGRYSLSFLTPLPNFGQQVRQFRRAGREPDIRVAAKPLMEFDFGSVRNFPVETPITAFTADGKNLLYGDASGNIYRFAQGHTAKVCQVPSRHRILLLRSADMEGNENRWIIAADDNEDLYVLGRGGNLLWKRKLSGYRGKADATDITVANLGKKGKAILVATAAWEVYAFDPHGGLLWKTTTKYHAETKVRVLKRTDTQSYVAVGTEYQTPLNILSPTDGHLLWYTWEEMGSEFLSTTQYCGFGLTAMLALDTDHSGKRDVIFGTKANAIYALDLANGATQWQANVGDEVTAMRSILNPGTGERMILVATNAGDLFEYSRSGHRLRHYDFGSGIMDIHTLPYQDRKRIDIVLTLQDGSVIICDDALRIRAAFNTGGQPLLGMTLGPWSDKTATVYAVSPHAIYTATYLPYFLRPSRTY